jgi:hypothetical protein
MQGPVIEPRYLGDGVYASTDGYHIVLAADDHRNPALWIEPAVMRALIAFSEELKKRQREAAAKKGEGE